MQKKSSLYLFGLSLLLAAPGFAKDVSPPAVVAAPTVNDSAKSAAITAQIDAVIAKYPLFAILVEDQKNFRKTWQNKLELSQILIPKQMGNDAALNTGITLAMDYASLYVVKADDTSANQYLDATAFLMDLGTRDKTVCKMVLNEKADISKKEDAEAEERLGPVVIEKFLPALTSIVVSGRTGEKRILTPQEMQDGMLPVVLGMIKKHGQESVAGLATIEDKTVDPLKRCQVMAQMMGAIVDLPAPDRAGISRTMFAEGKE